MSVKIDRVSHMYMHGTPFEKLALNDVSLEIKSGEFVAIIGHTGSGKSTLIQTINGLIKPDKGRIFIDDIEITKKNVKLSDIRKRVGLVFQYPEYQLFEETVEKDVAFGPRNLGLEEVEINLRVKRAIETVGLSFETFKDKSPFELSGGEKRRVAIAGVIAMEPKILILDEPTAGLDPKGRDDILRQIKLLHDKYKITVIIVSHSMEDVAKVAEKVFVMHEGKCILNDTPSKVFSEIETLEAVGLAVPQVTYLIRALQAKGFNLSKDIFTIGEAEEEIYRILGGGIDD